MKMDTTPSRFSYDAEADMRYNPQVFDALPSSTTRSESPDGVVRLPLNNGNLDQAPR